MQMRDWLPSIPPTCVGAALTNADGTLSRDVMPDLLHPGEKGYDIWARQMEPTLLHLLAQP